MSALRAQTVIDHLKAECPSLGNRVYHQRDVNEVKVESATAFVVTLPHNPSANDGMGALVSQPKERRFAVSLRAPAPRDDKEPMIDAADEIDAALVGWSPEEPIQVLASSTEMAEPEGALMTWILIYSWQDYERHVR